MSQTPTDAVTPDAAATPPPPAAEPAAKKPSFKDRIQGLSATLKAKFKKPAAEGKPAVAKPRDVKLALKNLGKDIASIPMLLIKGDAPTRLAVLGFVVCLVLLVRVIPELPRAAGRLMGWSAPQGPSTAETWTEEQAAIHGDGHGPENASLGPVVFLGAFAGNFQPAVPFSIEIFAETASEDQGQKLRASLEKAKPVLQKLLEEQLAADLESREGREELLERLRGQFAEGTVTRLFFTKFEMQTVAAAQSAGPEEAAEQGAGAAAVDPSAAEPGHPQAGH